MNCELTIFFPYCFSSEPIFHLSPILTPKTYLMLLASYYLTHLKKTIIFHDKSLFGISCIPEIGEWENGIKRVK